MRIAVLVPEPGKYSETFIRNHIENLPHDTVPLYEGEYPPYRGPDELEVFKDQGIDPVRPILRSMRDIYSGMKFRLNHLLNSFDVVLAEYGPTGVAVQQLCRRMDLPLVVHFHGRDAYLHQTLSENEQRYQQLFQSAEAIVGVSLHMCEHLTSLGAPESKVKLSPYGVDTDKFRGATPAENPPKFLAVGRFVEKKAPLTTIKAFARVRESHPESELLMVGEGPLLDNCRDWVRSKGLTDAVRFLGVVDHTEIAELHRTVRGYLQHSVRPDSGDAEGTPVAILEAMSSGLPVVSTRHAGIPETVKHEGTGFLVDEDDEQGMAEAIERLVRDPDLAASLGERGRERIRQDFTLKKSIGRLSRILETACS